MRYYSDDKTVEKALNATWLLVGIPFFIILFGVMIAGLYLSTVLNLTYIAPIGIVSGIALAGVTGYLISKQWFNYYIQRVTDPGQLYRRAISGGMLLPSTANKIVKMYEIDLTAKTTNYSDLPDKAVNEDILLTKYNIQISGTIIPWTDIMQIYLMADSSAQLFGDNATIMVCKNDATNFTKRTKVSSVRQVDFLIERYFNAGKLKK